MHYSNILLTIAEICGVLVGFANLASVFEKPSENIALRQVNKLRLLVVTEGGILGIFSCLLPFLIVSFNYSEITAFRTAAIIIALVSAINHFFNLKRAKRLTNSKPLLGNSLMLTIPLILINSFLIIIPLFLVGVGLIDDALIIGVFCLAILAEFLILSILLIRFIRQVI